MIVPTLPLVYQDLTCLATVLTRLMKSWQYAETTRSWTQFIRLGAYHKRAVLMPVQRAMNGKQAHGVNTGVGKVLSGGA